MSKILIDNSILTSIAKWKTPFHFYIMLMFVTTILIFSPYYFNLSPLLSGTILANTVSNSILLKISHGFLKN